MDATTAQTSERTALNILVAISVCHLLNDMLQSLLPAIYPMIAQTFGLDFTRIGLLTLAYQLTASILQPVVGLTTDRHPMPYSLAAGMASTLVGLVVLSAAQGYPALLAGAALMGVGSSIFHPEASRVARMASGGRHGLASRCSRSGAISVRPWGRCWPPSWWCRAGRRASAGRRWWRRWES